MKDIKKYLPLILQLTVAFLFLLSATAKIYGSPYGAITRFEKDHLWPLGFSQLLASYFSRLLIGFEFALGFLLLQPHYLKKIVIPVTIALLAIFIGQLGYEIITNDNAGNCGCFGELISMTPLEAIVKNVVAIGLLVWLLRLLRGRADRTNIWVLTTVVFGCILSIFMLAPIQPRATEITLTPIETEALADTVTNSLPAETPVTAPQTGTPAKNNTAAPATQAPVADAGPKAVKSQFSQYFASADKGKKIIGLFAPGCEHCRETAKQLTEMKAKDKNFPELLIIFMDEEADLIPEFFKVAGKQYPYKVLEAGTFWKTIGMQNDTPGVIYQYNGNKIKEWDGINERKFVASELKQAIKK